MSRRLRSSVLCVQGMGDLYCKLRLPYDDPEAIALDAEVMEAIYYGALEATVALAELESPYPGFAGSPASQGLLQFDMWEVAEDRLSGRWDWTALRARLAIHGMRNSMLTALMPTASTSQVLGNCESFEPFQVRVLPIRTRNPQKP